MGFHRSRTVAVTFDAPETSSDGGLLLLRQADEAMGLTNALARCVPDLRDPRFTRHTRHEQVRQRVYQIAMGYEDCNDADRLRCDPMFKTACDRTPSPEDVLSSQPTLSRFENAVTGASLNALREWFEDSYVAQLSADTDVVVLDIDATDDATHGGQQLTFFHGFYDQHQYYPLLVFDGHGELVTTLLRPGNAHAARGARSLLVRVIRKIKRRFPSAQIVVRADSGFCVPALLDALDALSVEYGDIDYIIGIAKNPRLLGMASEAISYAATSFEERRQYVRHFTSLTYAAQSWTRERHVIVKVEHQQKGSNPRFVVSTLSQFPPRLIYDVGYCGRGQSENFIKDLKNALAADRLSCSRYLANFFRLLLHAAAYRLMRAVRLAAAKVEPELGKLQFDTLRLRLLKVAAHLTLSARRILVRLPLSFPFAAAFAAIARALGPAG